MDKNSLIGLLLIGIIFFVYTAYFSPEPPPVETPENTVQVDSTAQNNNLDSLPKDSDSTDFAENNLPVQNDSVKNLFEQQRLEDKYGKLFAPFAQGEAQNVFLENDLIKVEISSKGGKVVSVWLKNFQTYDTLPLYLFHPDEVEFNFNYTAQNRKLSSEELFFKPNISGTQIAKTDKKASVSFKVEIAPNRYLEHVYSLDANTYLLDYQMNLVGLENIITGDANLHWLIKTPRQEKGLKDERYYSTTYYKTKEDVDYLWETSDGEETIEEAIHWVSLKQKFFNATMVAPAYFKSGKVASYAFEDDSHVKTLSADLKLELQHNNIENHNFQFYFGPTDYQILKETEFELDEIVALGWGIIGWFNEWLIIPIFSLLSKLNWSYGLIILLLTLMVRTIIFPLTYKSYTSMAKMKVLKPEMDAIKAKFPKDPQKQQAEQLKLWQQTGVSPLGGCLPMIIQLPILYAMFRFIPSAIELRQESFLWATDLSTYDDLITWTGEIPVITSFLGNHISIFTLLMTVSTVLQMTLNNSMSSGGGNEQFQKQMRIMMYFMPIVFFFVLNSFPAGLTYYYFLSNIIGFSQQYFIKRNIDEDKLRAKIDAKKIKNKGKKSNFQKRLEEMNKQRNKKK